MKIIVTGVHGFLGKHLAVYLSDKNHITGIKRDISNILNVNKYYLKHINDINEKPDVIIMCHGAVSSGNIELVEQELYDGNIGYTEKVLQKFPISNCIYISSVSVYKDSTNPILEDSEVNPTSEYAKSKYEAEQLVLNSRSNACVIRFSSLYGPNMKPHTLIPNYTKQALKNKTIEVWGSGKRRQNYIHISDAVELIEKVTEKEAFNHDIFLGTFTKEYSNKEVAQCIAEYTQANIVHVNDDNSKSVAYDNIYTRNKLNWEPKTDIMQGIYKYIEWIKKQY